MSLEQLHALPLLGGEGRTEPQHQGAISFFLKIQIHEKTETKYAGQNKFYKFTRATLRHRR